MTVADLIAALTAACEREGLDPAATRVYLDGYEGDHEDVRRVEVEWFRRGNGMGSHFGEHEMVTHYPMVQDVVGPNGRFFWREKRPDEWDDADHAAAAKAREGAELGLYLPRDADPTEDT